MSPLTSAVTKSMPVAYEAINAAPPSTAPTTLSAISAPRSEGGLRDLGSKARDAASEISTYALGLIGVNYKFGGNSPDQGLDCSGLIRYVFQQATGLSLPRTSREQAKVGKEIGVDDLRPGDLVFFNTRRFQFSHVGIYVGDNRFIHSPTTGKSVMISDMESSYWQKAFNGARRVVDSFPNPLNVLSSTAYAAPGQPSSNNQSKSN